MADYDSFAAFVAAGQASFARASVKYGSAGNGDYQQFASGELALTNRGALLEATGTRLSSYPASPDDWIVVGAGVEAHEGTFLGIFDQAVRVVAQGGGEWQRIQLAAGVLPAGDYGFVIIFSAGSSGRGRVTLRNDTAATETQFRGTIDQPGVPNGLAVTVSNAGPISQQLEEDIGGGIRRLSGVITTLAPGLFRFGIGPDTLVADEDIIVYGGWMEALAPSSPILDDPTSLEVSRPADELTLELPDFSCNLKVTFDDGSFQGFDGVSGSYVLDAASLNRRWVKSITATKA